MILVSWISCGRKKENMCDYVLHSSVKFEQHLKTVLSEYILKILEDGEWGEELETVAWWDLYCVNINVYNPMISPYLT